MVVNIVNYQTNPEVTMTDESLAERNVLITGGNKLVESQQVTLSMVVYHYTIIFLNVNATNDINVSI